MNQLINPTQGTDVMRAFAEHYELPLMGVTNMGGKPYVNSSGLMSKAKKIGLKSVGIVIEKTATKTDLSAIVKCTVVLKDGSEYEDYGFGSIESIKMSTLHNPDFINMTTITRAKNRALRSATGFGLVSVEEMAAADNLYANPQSDLAGSKLITLSNSTPIEIEPIGKPSDIQSEPVEVTLGELTKKEDAMAIAAEIFGVEEENQSVTVDPREMNEKRILAALEKNPKYPVERMLGAFMANNLSDLTDSQLDICVKAVEKNKQF